jgi:hypothetical protein
MTSSYCDAAHVDHHDGFPFPIKVRRAPARQERRSSPELDCSAVPVPETSERDAIKGDRSA